METRTNDKHHIERSESWQPRRGRPRRYVLRDDGIYDNELSTFVSQFESDGGKFDIEDFYEDDVFIVKKYTKEDRQKHIEIFLKGEEDKAGVRQNILNKVQEEKRQKAIEDEEKLKKRDEKAKKKEEDKDKNEMNDALTEKSGPKIINRGASASNNIRPKLHKEDNKTLAELMLEMFQSSLPIPMVPIPYPYSYPAIPDLYSNPLLSPTKNHVEPINPYQMQAPILTPTRTTDNSYGNAFDDVDIDYTETQNLDNEACDDIKFT
jgi:hypothetical protein